MKIRNIIITAVLGFFILSCNNDLPVDYTDNASTLHFNISLPGQSETNARMMTPTEDAVSEFVNSLSYSLDLSYSANGSQFTPMEEGRTFTSLTFAKLFLEEMSFRYGTWKIRLTGLSSGSPKIQGSTTFTVSSSINTASIKMNFVSQDTGTIKYSILLNEEDVSLFGYALTLYTGAEEDPSKEVSISTPTPVDTFVYYGGQYSNHYTLRSYTISGITPGEYCLKILGNTQMTNTDSPIIETVYVYPGLTSERITNNVGPFYIRLYYDCNNAGLYNANLNNQQELPGIIIFDGGNPGYADMVSTDGDNGSKFHVLNPYREGYMFTGWYETAADALAAGTPFVPPYTRAFWSKDSDGYIIKKNYTLHTGWKSLDSVLPGNKEFYVQLAQGDNNSSNGFIVKKDLSDLPDILTPVNVSNSNTNPGFTNVSTCNDYIIDNGYIYFFSNKYHENSNNLNNLYDNTVLKWTPISTSTLDLDDSDNYPDGDKAIDFYGLLWNNEPCLGKAPDTLLDRIYIADDVLYIAGHNTLQGFIFMITCNINPTTHIPDASTVQLSWVKSLNGVQDFYAFAVNSTNAVACYKDDDDDIIITSCKLDADGKLDVYVDQEGNNIAVDSVTKGLSDIYSITTTELAGSDISSTDCHPTDIYVYNDNFYVLINETNAATSETNVRYGDTIVSTGTILKLNSSLTAESNYFSTPDIKSYSIQTSNDGVKNLKMKLAQSPADLNHFMGPNRILGVSDSGKKLIISDDGLYSWEQKYSKRHFKWEHRIVIFNLITAEIEYYIPVNILYRGGSKTELNLIENYSYWDDIS